ncbi:MAG: winged helix-turn-helix transcriptional regulator [Candidatus Buchananbacteria bacterium]|nr:winged helix-turn-helix transcriptional regulator [Candidatus Buchananbacteria bacterium]
MKNSCINKNLDTLAEQVKVIGEPNRLKIICLLKTGPKCVCEIFEFLKLPQNLVSHHLKILLDVAIVNNQRDGKKIVYSLNQKTMTTLLKELKNILTI